MNKPTPQGFTAQAPNSAPAGWGQQTSQQAAPAGWGQSATAKKPQGSQPELISGIITKANGKDKVIDFRDGLVPAYPSDYAMLFGEGGKKHAPKSVIRVVICDFTKGTGAKSVTVQANLEMEVVSILRAVAENRMLSNPNLLSGQALRTEKPAEGRHITESSFQSLVQAYSLIVSKVRANIRALSEPEFMHIGSCLKAIYQDAKNSSAPPVQQKSAWGKQPAEQKDTADYKYSQERVNVYKLGANGLPQNFAPVNKLLITHKTLRDDGSVSRYPWTIKITNGIARVKVSPNGATSYDGSTFQVQSDAFMNISDADMFRMMHDCSRFIDAYTMAFGSPLIRDGVALKNQQRESWLSNQQMNRT